MLNARDVARCYVGTRWMARDFPFWLSMSVLLSTVLLLILGLGGHNLYRYTWLWYGAFLAIALRCARDDCTQGDDIDAVHFSADNPPLQALSCP